MSPDQTSLQVSAPDATGAIVHSHVPFPGAFVPRSMQVGKRIVDIAAALFGLVLTAPLFVLVALAVKLDSKGPAIYRQMRVGRALADRTELFMILKFRSMRVDAEVGTGAVWAQKRDPRVTRVGRFIRLTRLDEIPQLINILRGDMSLIGPRPERPGLVDRLDRALPFYADRMMGLRPGVTGLAQVMQGYDTDLEGVRRKVALDAAYAMQLSGFWSWLRTDLRIIARTVLVVLTAAGQ